MPRDAAFESHAEALLRRFADVRARSVSLAAPLGPEDQVVQSQPDSSPTKWHLAHTTWFWETFVCAPHAPDWRPVDADYAFLFNSYYESMGPRHARPERGLLTRPSIDRVMEYRERVDEGVLSALARCGEDASFSELIMLGVAHEEQHQELLLMDIQHLFASQPTYPAYATRPPNASGTIDPLQWVNFAGGLTEVGWNGGGFAFDNEGPRHRVWLEPYALGDRLITNGEWLGFMADGGYATPTLWLSDGWERVRAEGWCAPLYWQERDGQWQRVSLHGLEPVDPDEPVTHVSLYEADAFARWAGARLPTEFEWEAAAQAAPVVGNFLDSGDLRPRPAPPGEGIRQLFGDVWEWTSSAYAPYPGYQAAVGAIGEYNGKFMVSQTVLRGGCCVTPPGHVRATYRNFYHPHQRWMFSGLRLARDVGVRSHA